MFTLEINIYSFTKYMERSLLSFHEYIREQTRKPLLEIVVTPNINCCT
jgi:hypothetical protein